MTTLRIKTGAAVLLGLAAFGVGARAQTVTLTIRVPWAKESQLLISRAKLVYPPLAEALKLEGTVLIRFTVSTDGTTKNLSVLSSASPLLVQTSVDNVKTWKFQPTLLNGQPVEAITSAPVLFFIGAHTPETYLAPYRKAVEKHPNDAKSHLELGRALLGVGDSEASVVELRKAVDLDSSKPEPHFALGDALVGNAQTDAAIAEYRTGIAEKPKDGDAHLKLGELLESKGDLDEAESEYRLGAGLLEGQGYRHADLGEFLLQRGKYDDAAKEFDSALSHGFDFPAVHYELGRIAEHKGDFEQAEKQYKRAAQQAPSNGEYRQALERVTKGKSPN